MAMEMVMAETAAKAVVTNNAVGASHTRGACMISAKALLLASLVAMTGIAAISAWIVTEAISEGDAGSAWVWLALFLIASLLDVWAFWRLL